MYNDEPEVAGHHAVTGTGYVVAGAMMAAPTGITQIGNVPNYLFCQIKIFNHLKISKMNIRNIKHPTLYSYSKEENNVFMEPLNE